MPSPAQLFAMLTWAGQRNGLGKPLWVRGIMGGLPYQAAGKRCFEHYSTGRSAHISWLSAEPLVPQVARVWCERDLRLGDKYILLSY